MFSPEKFSDYSIVLSTLHPVAPGPVSELSYEENTDTSVTVTWKPPKEPNGDLVAYFVEHGVYQNESTRSVAMDARRPQHAVIRALSMLLLLHIVLTFISKSIYQVLILIEDLYWIGSIS